MVSIKLIASQARCINQYKNLRVKVLKYCAYIYFNRQCLKRDITPKHASIKIPYTSPATNVTQKKVQINRIREKAFYVVQNKNYLFDVQSDLILSMFNEPHRRIYYSYFPRFYVWKESTNEQNSFTCFGKDISNVCVFLLPIYFSTLYSYPVSISVLPKDELGNAWSTHSGYDK